MLRGRYIVTSICLRSACLRALSRAREVRLGVWMKIVRRARVMASIWKSVGVVTGANGKAPQREASRERNARGSRGD